MIVAIFALIVGSFVAYVSWIERQTKKQIEKMKEEKNG
jgi:hypothetical protein